MRKKKQQQQPINQEDLSLSIKSNTPIQFPELEKLISYKSYITKQLPYKKDICEIAFDENKRKKDNFTVIKPQILTKKLYQQLINIAQKSPVGKNKKTEIDTSVRKSYEILQKNIEFHKEFTEFLNKNTNKMMQELCRNKDFQVTNIKFHKFLIYEKDCRFSQHIDAQHQNDMLFTLAVELPCEANGGELQFKDGNKIQHVSQNNQISLTLFHHDLVHEVLKINDGHKISLTFDVCVKSQKCQTEQAITKQFSDYMKIFKEKGVKKIGFFTKHTYIGQKEVTIDDLKCFDSHLAQLLLQNSSSYKIFNTYSENGLQFYREEVQNLQLNLTSSHFSNLYHQIDDYQLEEEEEEHKTTNQDTNLIKTLETDLIVKNIENFKYEDLYEDKSHSIVKDEYKLGDVLLIHTDTRNKVMYQGDEEIHLGNQGFYGNIYANIMLVFELE